MICTACRRAVMRTRTLLPLRTAIPRAAASPIFIRQTPPSLPRFYSSPAAADEEEPDLPSMTPAESAIADILSAKLSPSQLLVQDVSGGCGSMYAIDITSAAFKGQTILKQQRMVNAALGDLVKGWHGVQIRTKVPDA
ncbi:hypothetical protein ACJ41O_003847 [Fusarium nematophilum]